MLSFLDAVTTLHTRGITFDIKQYIFSMMVAFGEDKAISYSLVYDTDEFKKHLGTEEEEEFIAEHGRDAEIMCQQQECKHLIDLISGWLQSKIQRESSNIKNVKYTTEDVANMLSSLLFERSSNLEDASVRDIVSLIRELNSQGALDGDGAAFSKHFVNIFPHLSAVCPYCQKETDVAVGLTCHCIRCGGLLTWSEEEHRYYPEITKL